MSKNAVVLGKRHENKILKVQISMSRNFVVIAQAPREALFGTTSEKRASPAVLRGREFWIHALQASNAPKQRIWGFAAVLIFGKAPKAFPGSFQNYLEVLPESPSRTGSIAYLLRP